jgi:hypothetical protein
MSVLPGGGGLTVEGEALRSTTALAKRTGEPHVRQRMDRVVTAGPTGESTGYTRPLPEHGPVKLTDGGELGEAQGAEPGSGRYRVFGWSANSNV